MSTPIYPKNSTHRTKYYQSSLEAGGGKSHTTYTQIAKSGNKTIIVIPRIDLIEEQVKLFNDKAVVVHSRDDNPNSVVDKISDAIHLIQADNNDKHVLIITHNGFIQYNRWHEIEPVWDLVIDEHMEYYQLISMKTKYSSQSQSFWDLFELADEDDGLSEVKFTKNARTMFTEKNDIWHTVPKLASLYLLSANNWIAINPDQWCKQTDTISFAALLNFDMLEQFTTVKFLADGFSSSPLCNYLTVAYGIHFHDLNIAPYKPRRKSLAERVTIYQVANHDISNWMVQRMESRHFTEIDFLVNQIADKNNTIWTTNQKYKHLFNINGTYLTPKQSGTNEYSDKTTAIWFASMKTLPQNISVAKSVARLNHEILTTIQELEPLHQFVTRINIRLFDDDAPVNIVVFGPQQAEYLAERYGISKDAIVQLSVDLPEKNKPGPKPKPKVVKPKQKPGRKPSPLSRAERMRWSRYKKKVESGKATDPIKNAWFVEAARKLGKYEDRFGQLPLR